MSSVYRFIVPAITAMHAMFTIYLFVDMFGSYSGWTNYHARPFFMLIYTLIWLLIQFRHKWAVWVYLLLTLFDGACKYVYPNTVWGNALEQTLFPLSMIFLALFMLMYKSHFDVEKQNQ